jgi:hypothetical protein
VGALSAGLLASEFPVGLTSGSLAVLGVRQRFVLFKMKKKPEMIGAQKRTCLPGGFAVTSKRAKNPLMADETISAANKALYRLKGHAEMYSDNFGFGSFRQKRIDVKGNPP